MVDDSFDVSSTSTCIALQLRLQRLEKQITDCKAAYDREESTLKGKSGEAEYNIEKNLERLETEIGKLDTEIRICRRQLESNHITELITCLQSCDEDVQKAVVPIFYRSLPINAARRITPSSKNITSLVKTLANSGQVDGAPYPALVMFVGQILQSDLFIPGLRDWLANQLSDTATSDQTTEQLVEICLTQIEAYFSQRQQSSQSCLLLRVNQAAQQSAQENQRQYTLRGWYIEDIQQYRSNFSGVLDVYLPGDSLDKPLTFAALDLESKVRTLINGCLGQGRELPNSLQIFLPPELMGQPIDSWCSHDLEQDPEADPDETLGADYDGGVLIRCNERLSSRRIRRSDWQKCWQVVQQYGDKKAKDFFLAADETNVAVLGKKLPRQANAFGLKLKTCLSISSEQALLSPKATFKKLSLAPIPAALWLRQPPADCSCEETLNELLESGHLQAIPETVYDRRLEMDHIGQHLSLMWDDPYLLPPDFQIP